MRGDFEAEAEGDRDALLDYLVSDDALGLGVDSRFRYAERDACTPPLDTDTCASKDVTDRQHDSQSRRAPVRMSNLFHDLAKRAVVRSVWAKARELREHGVAAVAVAPRFMRTERVVEAFRRDGAPAALDGPGGPE